MEALQPQPQHPGLQEQARDQSSSVSGAGQVGGDKLEGGGRAELHVDILQDISEPSGGMTLLARSALDVRLTSVTTTTGRCPTWGAQTTTAISTSQ